MSTPRKVTFQIESAIPTLPQHILKQAQDRKLRKLDFSNFEGNVTVPATLTVQDSDLVTSLIAINKRCPYIDVVDLSGHSEIVDVDIAQFRKYLPRLKTIILRNISVNQFCISAAELAHIEDTYIDITANAELLISIQKRIADYRKDNADEESVKNSLKKFTEDREEKMAPETAFFENGSPTLKAYIESVKTKEPVANQIHAMKLTEKEKTELTVFIDPVTKRYMQTPVRLHECYYDLSTVIGFNGTVPDSNVSFMPCHVQSGADLMKKLRVSLFNIENARVAFNLLNNSQTPRTSRNLK